jgi:hypothetical protein
LQPNFLLVRRYALSLSGARCYLFPKSTPAKSEKSVSQFSAGELAELGQIIRKARRAKEYVQKSSLRDTNPVSVGMILKPIGTRDDWYTDSRTQCCASISRARYTVSSSQLGIFVALAFAPARADAQGIAGELAALKAQVAAPQTQVNTQQEQIITLQNQLANAKDVLALEPFVSVDPNSENGVIGPNIKFTGALSLQ